MTPKLDKKLCKEFPNIFHNHEVFGFPGDGWYNIIREVCLEMQTIQKKTGIQYSADQVKEKFGGLRFYFHEDKRLLKVPMEERGDCYRRIRDKVDEIENRSYKICEVCGEPGNQRSFGWVRTLCDKCEENRNDEKE